MTQIQQNQDLCLRFATLFSYPGQGIAKEAADCLAGLQKFSPEASVSLASFVRFVEDSDVSQIEEAYTGTFDLQSLCHPYVGYQLCGESQQRTMFMIKLRELYTEHGFVPGNELPDHLAEVLRFLGSILDEDCRQEIIRNGLLPALEQITKGVESDNRPYLRLLDSLQNFLIGTAMSDAELQSIERQKECLS